MRLVLRQCVASALVLLSLVLLLCSIWLPQGSVQSCGGSLKPCLSEYKSSNRDDSAQSPYKIKGSDIIIRECDGQAFQVSRLLRHLNTALGPSNTVLLEPYLLSWEELIKFMEALGPLVGFFTHKVEEKISFLRQLSQEESLSAPPLSKGHAYHSVHSMLEAELQRGVVSFTEPLPSGSRLFLRLHRSMRFVMLLLEKLWSEPEERSLVELCREAYEEVLAPHHPWLLQRAAQVAFAALPDRSVFLPLLCVRGMKEAEPVMRTVITVMEEIQRRSQRELESRGMMDLP